MKGLLTPLLSLWPRWIALRRVRRRVQSCVCDGKLCEDRWYRCRTCRRDVPWCFGAADAMPDDCDDCWYEANKDDKAAA